MHSFVEKKYLLVSSFKYLFTNFPIHFVDRIVGLVRTIHWLMALRANKLEKFDTKIEKNKLRKTKIS